MNTCCSVCCEKFNKTTRKNVTCPFCNFESCKTCVQTYLLSNVENAHCMKCKHEFNRGFVDSFCTKRFRNIEYKKHREQVLFEREKVRMPETQPQVERILRMREIRNEYHTLMNVIRGVMSDKREAQQLNQTTSIYENMEIELNIKIDDLVTEMNKLRNEYDDPDNTDDSQRRFVRTCPSENCRGFIENDWKCGLCKKQFCKDCNEELTKNHVCNPQTVKTMKLINKDTRPCPKCGTMIHKIDGCQQMWCTSCNTAFNWKTGKIETGRIHNPHYFEFQKRSREHADVPCGGRPSVSELNSLNAPGILTDILMILNKIDRDLMYKYVNIYDEDNRHIRTSYMLGSINEEEFKTELQRRDKNKDKIQDIRDIYEMFSNSVSDFLRQWVINPEKNILDDVYELLNYSNEIIFKIRNRYASSTPNYIHILQT